VVTPKAGFKRQRASIGGSRIFNEGSPGDPRDAARAAAMLQNIQLLVLGDVLSASSRQQLTAWLLGNKTGDTRS